jgi:hypothetical protein
MSLIKRVDKTRLLRWAAEFSLAISLIYALFYLASILSLQYFTLSNRGMVQQTVGGSVLSGPLDVAVWGTAVFVVLLRLGYSLGLTNVRSYFHSFSAVRALALLCGLAVWVCLVFLDIVGVWSLVIVSSLLLGACAVFATKLFGISQLGLFLRLLLGAFLVGLFVEAVTFALFSAPVALNFEPGAIGLHWNIVELSFSNLAYPFLPYGYLLFVLLGIVFFALKAAPEGWLSKIYSKRFSSLFARFSGSFELGEDDGLGFLRSRFVLVAAVFVGALVSFLFVLFTVLPWTNPTNILVSVDSPDYYQWIVHMQSVNVNGALSFALANDRALFLILAYALSFFASPLIVIQFVAALLIVLLGLVSLMVMRIFCSFRAVWVLAVLLVPFSFQALALIYNGYFANMLALVLLLVYVVLFFRVLGSWSSLGFFAVLGVSVLILLSHSWTWFVFAFSLLAYLFLEWRLAAHDESLWPRFKEKCVLVGTTVGVGLIVDFVRNMLFSSSSSVSVLSTAHSSLSFPNPVFVLSGIVKMVNFDSAGIFANGLIVAFSIVGFLFLVRFRSEVSNFFVSWIFIASVSILFAAEDFVFGRFLFLMPWVVLSSFGLFSILRFVSNRFDGKWRWLICFVVLAFVFSMLLNNGLRYLFNVNV